jgi:hypothetical protein
LGQDSERQKERNQRTMPETLKFQFLIKVIWRRYENHNHFLVLFIAPNQAIAKKKLRLVDH